MITKEILKQKGIGVYGDHRAVNDFCYVFETVLLEGGTKYKRLYKDSRFNTQDCEIIIDTTDTLKGNDEYAVLDMHDCFDILDLVNVGSWSYGSDTQPKNRKIESNRKLLLWGICEASDFFLKTNSEIMPDCIIDNNPTLQGTRHQGIEILSPTDAFERYADGYVLIMSRKKIEIRDQMINTFGKREMEDFAYYNFYGPYNLSASQMMKKTMGDSSKNVKCFKPFEFCYTEINGELWTCCYAPGVSVGNLLSDYFTNAWKSVFGTIIRLSMINQTYSFCNSFTCPYLITEDNLYNGVIYDDKYDLKVTDYPDSISISHDNSCNLFCESCRNSIFISNGDNKERSVRISKALLEEGVLDNVRDIIMAGNGEVFVGGAYREIFQNGANCIPESGYFNIFTNGQLFNEDNWNIITEHWRRREFCLVVSIDAACKDTYEGIRRNASWDRLMSNLEFAQSIRKQGKLKRITFDFVVQQKNIYEMKDFVIMSEKLSCDNIMFSAIANWGTYDEQEFEHVRVLDEEGYLAKKYEPFLSHPIFRQDNVDLGNIHIRRR